MSDLLTRAKYSSSTVVELANRWKFHARYRWSGVPFDTKYQFLSAQSLGTGTILDIGANYGQSALSMRHFAPDNPIVCVEANPTLTPAMELARRRIADCSYIIAAVSDAVGVQELTIPMFGHVANTGGASLDAEFVQGRLAQLEERYKAPHELRTQVVPMITVDCLGLDVPLLKIDVEGVEARVLRGAEATISRCRPIIVMEVMHSSGDAMDLLKTMEYSFFLPSSRGLIATSPETALATGAMDVVALPSEQSDIS